MGYLAGHNAEVQVQAAISIALTDEFLARSSQINDGVIYTPTSDAELHTKIVALLRRIESYPTERDEIIIKEIAIGSKAAKASVLGKRQQSSSEHSDGDGNTKDRDKTRGFCHGFNSEKGCLHPKPCPFEHKYVECAFFKAGKCNRQQCYFHHHDPAWCKVVHP
jgi:hypothetical protein